LNRSSEPTAVTELLRARCERSQRLAEIAGAHAGAISVTANRPGLEKQSPETSLLVRLFTSQVRQLLHPPFCESFNSADGEASLFGVQTDPFAAKRLLTTLEAQHPLGAYIDLDLVTENGRLSRKALNLKPRRCPLCGDAAKVCARSRRHDPHTFNNQMRQAVCEHLARALAEEACLALRQETFTYPSLALVSSRDCGRHADMNISHFLASIAALRPFFVEYARAGLDGRLESLRPIGRRAEETMYAKAGVNTHKGANFLFGLAIAHSARAIWRGGGYASMRRAVAEQARTLSARDFAKAAEGDTNGLKAYKARGMRGVRGEAERGFDSIFAWFPREEESRLQKLFRILARTEDTTLLRHGEAARKDIQELAGAVEDGPEPLMLAAHERLKRQGVSPGGAADLLALEIFFGRIGGLMQREGRARED